MATTTGTTIPLLEQGMKNGDQAYNEGAWINNLHNQPIVQSITDTPPAIVNGEAYIVAPGATGAWAGQDNNLALAFNDSWHFYAPSNGWNFYNVKTEHYHYFNGVSWSKTGSPYESIGEADNVSPISQSITTSIQPIDMFEAVEQSKKMSVGLTPSGNGNRAIFTPDPEFYGFFNVRINLYGEGNNNSVVYTIYVNDGTSDIVLGEFESVQKRLQLSAEKYILLPPGASGEFKIVAAQAQTFNCTQIYASFTRQGPP